MGEIGRGLVVLGVVLVAVGALLAWAPQVPWLGKLPGDIRIERPGGSFYFPLASCVLISIVLSLLLNLFGRGR
ncbi:MAG TPA: DUF2905 domain-containing protein [Myxococcota bacterium]|jgi:hypothetical protein|nr:DUF2905 domain-containing protein [Myxococcota bacterium]